MALAGAGWRVALTSCASTPNACKLGELAEQREDFDEAVVAYAQAQVADPDDKDAALALKRAKLRASAQHYAKGRRLSGAGTYEEALVEFQMALELNPANADAEAAVRETRTALRTKMAVRKDGITQLESVISRARALPPQGRELPEVTLPDSLVFREAGSRDVLTSLARFAGISLVFDPQFRSVPLSIDLRGSSLPAALDAIGRATGTFWRVTAPATVTIVPDTAAKRREYEEEVIRTFYLSNADLKETLDLLRIVVDARRLSPITATNAISIKDTPERIEAAGRLLTAIDKARAEVVIDVELLEVDRTRFKQYGIQIVSPGNDIGIAGQVDINQPGTGVTLEQLTNLGQGDVFFTTLPGLYYRLLKQDTDTRVLANPQLRTSDGLPAQAKFGEEVPVPQVTFAPIATGGVNQQPITSFTYRNVGVNIDITPRTHHNDDVSLAVKIEISSVAGTGYSGLPTFNTRSITTTIRLRDGETNLLAGLIRDSERTVLKGLPGLSDIPVARQDLLEQRTRDPADRRRADAHAAHHPRARPRRGGSAAVPGRSQWRPRVGQLRRADGHAAPAPPHAATRRRRRTARAVVPAVADDSRAAHPADAAAAHAASAADSTEVGTLSERPCGASESAPTLNPLSRRRRRGRSGAPPPARSRARRSRAGPTTLSPSAARAAAIRAIPERRSLVSRWRPRSGVGPVTTMRCESQRKMSARMPLSCSRANRRNSYIQSWISVRPCAWVASTVNRLTMSLGNPGHRPVTRRPMATQGPGLTCTPLPVRSQGTCIRCSTLTMGSRSSGSAPRTSIAPRVTAAITAHVPASM